MKATLCIMIMAIAFALSASPLSAQRDIKIELNKRNFDNFDTVRVTASFIGFDDNPIVGDVYADIINPKDSIIQSGIMHRNADGTYNVALPVPPNELNTHSDITKLCHLITISNGSVLRGDRYVPIVSPDLYISSNVVDKSYPTYDITAPGNGVNAFNKFKEIPFSSITYISVVAFTEKSRKNYSGDFYIWVETQRSHPLDNVFTLQVFAETENGETVAGIEHITLPVIEFRVFKGDLELQESPNNLSRVR